MNNLFEVNQNLTLMLLIGLKILGIAVILFFIVSLVIGIIDVIAGKDIEK